MSQIPLNINQGCKEKERLDPKGVLRPFPKTEGGEYVTKRQGILDGWEEQHRDMPDVDIFIPKVKTFNLADPSSPYFFCLEPSKPPA